MKNRLPRLSAEHILYSIAIANALRLAWAYATADAGGNVISLPGTFGLLLGSAVSIGTAFISGRLAKRMSKGQKWITWSAFILLLIMEPLILAPITFSDMPARLSAVMGIPLSWVWSATLALVPSLVIAGVAVANGGLVETITQGMGSEPEANQQGAGTTPKADGKKKPVAGKVAVSDEQLLELYRKDPAISDEKMAKHFGITRPAISQRRNKLQARGLMMKTKTGVIVYDIPKESVMAGSTLEKGRYENQIEN